MTHATGAFKNYLVVEMVFLEIISYVHNHFLVTS
jgi:hypothetical protein